MIPHHAMTLAITRFIFPCATNHPASSRGMSSGSGSPSPQAKSSPKRMKYPPHSNQACTCSGLKTANKSMTPFESVQSLAALKTSARRVRHYGWRTSDCHPKQSQRTRGSAHLVAALADEGFQLMRADGGRLFDVDHAATSAA